MQTPGLDATGGRGMMNLDALATEWGTRQVPTGKVVWFDVHPAHAPCGGTAPQTSAVATRETSVPQSDALHGRPRRCTLTSTSPAV